MDLQIERLLYVRVYRFRVHRSGLDFLYGSLTYRVYCCLRLKPLDRTQDYLALVNNLKSLYCSVSFLVAFRSEKMAAKVWLLLLTFHQRNINKLAWLYLFLTALVHHAASTPDMKPNR